MYFSSHPREFRRIVFEKQGFKAEQKKNYTLYQNPEYPENGQYHHYERKGYYEFGIASYTISQAFAIQFDNPDLLLRLGIVHEGVTRFQLDHESVSSFMPSAFLVLENGIRGKQVWEQGQYFHGAEMTVYPAFIDELAARFSGFQVLDYFIPNHTYHYLPAGILPVIHRLIHLDETDSLNDLHLEAAVLECMGIMKESGKSDGQNAFSRQVDYGCVEIGEGRRIRFTAQDFKTIQKARDILTEQFVSPPTIEALSQMLLINSQKLKAGFRYYYHMTIGEYVASLKMSYAATLLCTTEKTVAEIAREAGYGYSSNFSRKFQQTYSCTPVKYRMREKKHPGIKEK